MRARTILVASHGTEGARAAETAALGMIRPGSALFHLYMVEEFWLGMRGDDWLNNAATRIRFESHLEHQLEQDIATEVRRLSTLAAVEGAAYSLVVKVGRHEDCLSSAVREARPDLVVVGGPRPKGSPGFRSRMKVDAVIKSLGRPLLVVPHPAHIAGTDGQ